MLFGTNRSCAASIVTVGKRGKAHSVVLHHMLRQQVCESLRICTVSEGYSAVRQSAESYLVGQLPAEQRELLQRRHRQREGHEVGEDEGVGPDRHRTERQYPLQFGPNALASMRP